ncbi:U4/U6.U5 snRNP associated protein, partial [Dipsacomyces acuminosporus]
MDKNAYGEQKKAAEFRRKWDEDVFDKKARERERQINEEEEAAERRRKGLKPRAHSSTHTQDRELLQARKHAINLDEMVGKVQVVQSSSSASKQPGFYCKVCDVTVKDSLSYLDHINGRNHQRMLNRSMKVAAETLEDVKAKLESLRKQKLRQQTKGEYDFHKQVQHQEKADKEKKQRRKEAKKRRQQQNSEGTGDDGGTDADEMAAMMGFSGFGS